MQLTLGLRAMLHLLLRGMQAPAKWGCCCTYAVLGMPGVSSGLCTASTY